MVKVTKKDRIFMLAFPPVAITILYCWLWAIPVHRDVSRMTSHIQSLGSEEALAVRRDALSLKLTEARKLLQETESAFAAESGKKLTALDDAARLRRFCDVVVSCGGRILSTARVSASSADNSGGISSQLLRQAGVTTSAVWTIQIEAPFPKMAEMLRELGKRNIPSVPETIAMKDGTNGEKPKVWTITVCI